MAARTHKRDTGRPPTLPSQDDKNLSALKIHPTSTVHTEKVTAVTQTQLFLCVSRSLSLFPTRVHFKEKDNSGKHAFAATNVNWKHPGLVKA